ncbi:cell division protein FtsH, partial [Arthrobacter deserti]|nr:cell division protein FtsH [Arthrobacter deserti]
MSHERNYSDHVAFVVDEEVRRLIDTAHDEAYAILTENREVLDRLALALLERETLNQAEIAEIFQDLRKRDERHVWLSKETRPVHNLPPVLSPKERAEAAARANSRRGEDGHGAVIADPAQGGPELPGGVPPGSDS